MNSSQVSVATSLAAIMPSRIRELANVAFAMDGVYKLQFGESNLPTPAYITDALAAAVADGYTFYSENVGLPSLRELIAATYERLHHVEIDPAHEIQITAGGVQALNLAIRCALNPGDEAIILTPNWPNATEIVRLYGATPVELPYHIRNGEPTIDYTQLQHALSPRTRIVVYTSPSNPLGWVASESDQQRLLAFCRQHKLWLLADEVYERLYYAGPLAPSILRLCTRDDAVIVVQSFSKTYRMTGWRLGWMVGRRDLIQKSAQINEFVVSHAPSMIQRAGEAALRLGEDDLAAMVEQFHERMEFCYAALSSCPSVSLAKPRGAFYLFPRIEGLVDSYSFALQLLRETRVAVAPGNAFGAGGDNAIRLCFAPSMDVLEPAMERLCTFLNSRQLPPAAKLPTPLKD